MRLNKIQSAFVGKPKVGYLQTFNSIWNDKAKLQDVTDSVIENISSIYRENSPEHIYFITLYNIFSEFLEDISEDVLPNEGVGFKESLIWNKLYDFQKDAVLGISEGQNLQDCDYLVNYDIHWNPVRIIQRFGRIDRIGSKNDKIQLVNYWPDMTLDDYIQLRSKVETRMRITIMSATGDDDPINEEERGELEYRKKQLERLKNEVVDIEEMNTGISIMDLGLNEFRLDLLEYIKKHGEDSNIPFGLHAVVPASSEVQEGVIYILKNINDGVISGVDGV